MGLGRFARRLLPTTARKNDESEEVDPFAACASVPGRVSIEASPLRRSCTVAGLVRSVEGPTPSKAPSLEALIEDEAGCTVLAKWHRKEPIRGLLPGVTIALTGTIRERDGSRVMLDPSYTIIDGSLL